MLKMKVLSLNTSDMCGNVHVKFLCVQNMQQTLHQISVSIFQQRKITSKLCVGLF